MTYYRVYFGDFENPVIAIEGAVRRLDHAPYAAVDASAQDVRAQRERC